MNDSAKFISLQIFATGKQMEQQGLGKVITDPQNANCGTITIKFDEKEYDVIVKER